MFSVPDDQIYEFINRRWCEEVGEYPDATECSTIVVLVSIIQEYHKAHCPNLPDGERVPYRRQVPDRTKPRTLNLVDIPMKTKRAKKTA